MSLTDKNSIEFINATKVVEKLATKPDNSELCDLYGLYKQAIIGNNTTEKPSFINYTANQKWLAWYNFTDVTTREAEIKYITLVNTLIKKYGLTK